MVFEVRRTITTGAVIVAPWLPGAAVLGGGGAAVILNSDCAAVHCRGDTLGPNVGISGGTVETTSHRETLEWKSAIRVHQG